MPKKSAKAALRQRQKKKAKAGRQNKQNKNQNKQTNGKSGGKNDPSILGNEDVLKMTSNPDEHLKEFVRDINLHNFSRKQIIKTVSTFLYHHKIINHATFSSISYI